MGITVGPIVTPQGFEIPALYIRVNTCRFLLMQSGGSYHCIFTYEGFKSYEVKKNGCAPLSIPEGLRQAETIIPALDFLRSDIFEISYRTLKSIISGSYTVQDIYEPDQPRGSDYRFNKDGWDVDGFNYLGFNADGYDKFGFNAQGYDKDGYDRDGYNAEGYNRQGFDRNGFDKDGYDIAGFNASGYNREGFDRYGYDKDGYDKDGYNQAGFDRDGNPRPQPT